jgi:hypothetical protein
VGFEEVGQSTFRSKTDELSWTGAGIYKIIAEGDYRYTRKNIREGIRIRKIAEEGEEHAQECIKNR